MAKVRRTIVIEEKTSMKIDKYRFAMQVASGTKVFISDLIEMMVENFDIKKGNKKDGNKNT